MLRQTKDETLKILRLRLVFIVVVKSNSVHKSKNYDTQGIK